MQRGLEIVELYLRLRPKTVWIDYSAEASETGANIALSCSPTAHAAMLEIGAKHVFAPRGKLSFLSFLRRRRLRELLLVVDRQSELTPEIVEELNLSKSMIGKMWFGPAKKRDKSGPSKPAWLTARVWVNDELHESLRALLQATKRPTRLRLTLGIEEGGGLNYGWEPDGSRMVWKLANANEPSYLDVSSINIELNRSGPVRSLLLALGD